MPSMKELQDLLAQLDAEGGLAIGGGEDAGTKPGRVVEEKPFGAPGCSSNPWKLLHQ